MATNQWKCYECGHVGPTSEFVIENGGHLCPKPESALHAREDVFPHRLFQCTTCGLEGTQEDFYGKDCSLDLDPLTNGWEAECKTCGPTTVEQTD